jgi:HSP20 family molecular chaperone IbpA
MYNNQNNQNKSNNTPSNMDSFFETAIAFLVDAKNGLLQSSETKPTTTLSCGCKFDDDELIRFGISPGYNKNIDSANKYDPRVMEPATKYDPRVMEPATKYERKVTPTTTIKPTPAGFETCPDEWANWANWSNQYNLCFKDIEKSVLDAPVVNNTNSSSIEACAKVDTDSSSIEACTKIDTSTKISFAEKYMYYIDLPGVQKSNIRCRLDKDMLYIEGERFQPYCPPFTEISSYMKYGLFKHSIKIDSDVDIFGITTELNKEGVFIITVPRQNMDQYIIPVY